MKSTQERSFAPQNHYAHPLTSEGGGQSLSPPVFQLKCDGPIQMQDDKVLCDEALIRFTDQFNHHFSNVLHVFNPTDPGSQKESSWENRESIHNYGNKPDTASGNALNCEEMAF